MNLYIFSNRSLENLMNTHLAKRSLTLASLTLCTLCALSTQAMALDGYEDRRGFFGGLSVGGGVGLVESEEGLTGIDQGRKLGFHMSAMLGSGITERLTVYGEGNWWARSVQLGENKLASNHYSFNASSNLFLIEGLFIGAGAGLAYASYDAQRGPGASVENYRELGLSVKGGAGFETFVNGNTALGLKVDYTRHFYNNAEFDTLTAGFLVRWY